jgi:hypothetical protein
MLCGILFARTGVEDGRLVSPFSAFLFLSASTMFVVAVSSTFSRVVSVVPYGVFRVWMYLLVFGMYSFVPMSVLFYVSEIFHIELQEDLGMLVIINYYAKLPLQIVVYLAAMMSVALYDRPAIAKGVPRISATVFQVYVFMAAAAVLGTLGRDRIIEMIGPEKFGM